MKLPSRHMPAYQEPNQAWSLAAFLMLSGLLGLVLYVLWRLPWALLFIVWAVYGAWRCQRRLTAKFAVLRQQRHGESICQFARSFDCRHTDTWVIRAVYEQVSEYVAMGGVAFPLRASDSLFELLEIDRDDLEIDLLEEVAQRTGRSLAGIEKNPLFGRVSTVGDLVYFFNAQPRLVLASV